VYKTPATRPLTKR